MPQPKLPARRRGEWPAWMHRALDPDSPSTKWNESVRTASTDWEGRELLFPMVRLNPDGTWKRFIPPPFTSGESGYSTEEEWETARKRGVGEALQESLKLDDYLEFDSPEEATEWSIQFSNRLGQMVTGINMPSNRFPETSLPNEEAGLQDAFATESLPTQLPDPFGSSREVKETEIMQTLAEKINPLYLLAPDRQKAMQQEADKHMSGMDKPYSIAGAPDLHSLEILRGALGAVEGRLSVFPPPTADSPQHAWDYWAELNQERNQLNELVEELTLSAASGVYSTLDRLHEEVPGQSPIPMGPQGFPLI